jgi:D-aminopeptidase
MNKVDPHMATPAGKRRARALGIPMRGVAGPFNAITDVDGVEVGYCTRVEGEGRLEVGKGPIRTGVTVILPRGREGLVVPVFAGCHVLNGNGEMTGTIWMEEVGLCESPIALTNTHSLGLVRDALIKWMVEHVGLRKQLWWGLPVVAETYDGWLNDINGFHIHDEHVYAALAEAHGGAIEQGSVGGGTGMICYEFKGGSGSASRLVELGAGQFTVGAFVQSNFGSRKELTIAGVPVGEHLKEDLVYEEESKGSIIGVVATDAPLLPHQCRRLARRISLGVGRSGTASLHGSGDIFVAFSTANREALMKDGRMVQARYLRDRELDPFFTAVVQAIDEAIIDSMIANQRMTGAEGHVVEALPHSELIEVLQHYGRWEGFGEAGAE